MSELLERSLELQKLLDDEQFSTKVENTNEDISQDRHNGELITTLDTPKNLKIYQSCLSLFIQGNISDCLQMMLDNGLLNNDLMEKNKEITELFIFCLYRLPILKDSEIELFYNFQGMIESSYFNELQNIKMSNIRILQEYFSIYCNVLKLTNAPLKKKILLKKEVENQLDSYLQLQDISIDNLKTLIEFYIFEIEIGLLEENRRPELYLQLEDKYPTILNRPEVLDLKPNITMKLTPFTGSRHSSRSHELNKREQNKDNIGIQELETLKNKDIPFMQQLYTSRQFGRLSFLLEKCFNRFNKVQTVALLISVILALLTVSRRYHLLAKLSSVSKFVVDILAE
ncbi:hypothetical protein TBLA_0E02280 [Henningerozyma blattae CBS 6284]|uniref:Uncharacterized protein n=1 Tax=Henningerozyma blattae (strain ATCC 34711 / CBS 6284 / DSM 70876 / NBRC 10599 / NRRL Y-10934 / UCD 77-7) TaxID=1071380 RepID=I2H4H9_HENB6|nr:hypothetical protein TBLA_0E02280 [Tetrapisispora blattae CBS 6284]CCH61281.1 hypothetical protein TBLA_0E02280 [Tetrapisispora blattae CBS 6284]